MKKLSYLIFLFIGILGSSCQREAKWEIKGVVEGASEEEIYLEASFNSRWYALDSTKLSKQGTFKFKEDAPANPTIYRLTLNGRNAYFPVDSIETVSFKTTAANFGKSYELSGSTEAELMNEANALLNTNDVVNSEQTKRKLAELILRNPSGATAYYVINSRGADGIPVFDSSNRSDLRIIGAVANAYVEQRPNDPRTAYVKDLYLGSRASGNENILALPDTLSVKELEVIEIDLMDETGAQRPLTSLTGKGPILLSFTMYTADFSPALNLELGKLYEELSPKGLEIYQVGFDADEFQWRQSAKNIPWVTVYNSPKDGITYLSKYNVGQLPAFFVINRKGELVERIDDPAEVAKTVKKYM
ncbi:MAG: DUF4369 domain-containing protein [Muribaculaceae bacterium]|nr:DUF4369 domain-containing protein [Muribaculaceae bacterium]